MLQVINKEFSTLEKLVEYINKVSINYDYFKDYQVIKEEDKYKVLLNFDIPKAMQILELAKLKETKSMDYKATESSYMIEVENTSSATGSSIYFSELKNGVQIQGFFSFDGTYDLIQSNHDTLKDYFTIELRNFKYGYMGWSTEVENILSVKEVDPMIIYNHLVKVIIIRGYLIDRESLKRLKYNIDVVSNWLNRKNFD